MKIAVILPAYNEDSTIGDLISRVKSQALIPVVVDDGSSDNTSSISSHAGAVVIRNELNQGKGAALSRGLEYCLKQGFDAVVVMDSDGQHLPEDIPRFIKQAQVSSASVFIGNRMTQTRSMPLLRFVTNSAMSWIISTICREDIPDTQCGFRLLKSEALSGMRLSSRNYEIETEMIFQAKRLGLRIESVPIHTVYTATDNSRINPVVDTLRFIRFIFIQLWNMPSK